MCRSETTPHVIERHSPSTVHTHTQGVGKEEVPWRLTRSNEEFKLCETYPQLLGVPLSTNDDDLKTVAAFRSKGRFPVSHTHTHTHTHTQHLLTDRLSNTPSMVAVIEWF